MPAEAAARFASVVVGNVALVSLALTGLLWWGAEPLLRLQFPGFDQATLGETVRLMRIVLPAQVFFLTGGVLRGVLMAHGRSDPLLPYAAAEDLRALLSDAGLNAELVGFEGGHGIAPQVLAKMAGLLAELA